MSEEIYTVEERLEDALSNQIAELDNVKPGSDEYTNISRAITDLYKVRNEQQKIESDYALATESQEQSIAFRPLSVRNKQEGFRFLTFCRYSHR